MVTASGFFGAMIFAEKKKKGKRICKRQSGAFQNASLVKGRKGNMLHKYYAKYRSDHDLSWAGLGGNTGRGPRPIAQGSHVHEGSSHHVPPPNCPGESTPHFLTELWCMSWMCRGKNVWRNLTLSVPPGIFNL